MSDNYYGKEGNNGKIYRSLFKLFLFIGLVISVFCFAFYSQRNNEFWDFYLIENPSEFLGIFLVLGLPSLVISCPLAYLWFRERGGVRLLENGERISKQDRDEAQLIGIDRVAGSEQAEGYYNKFNVPMAKYSQFSLSFALASIVVYPFIFPPLIAVVLSIHALHEIKDSGYILQGKEKATSALVIGGIFLLFACVYWLSVTLGWAKYLYGGS